MHNSVTIYKKPFNSCYKTGSWARYIFW